MAKVSLAQTNYLPTYIATACTLITMQTHTYKVKIYRKRKFSVSDNCTIVSIGNHESTDIIHKWNDLQSNLICKF